MTCAKRQVGCYLFDGNGRIAYGENLCDSPVAVCPRLEGEGYEKCGTVCRQYGHAEIVALENWMLAYGLDGPRPSIALILGHFHMCHGCREALKAFGVVEFYTTAKWKRA